MSDPVLHVVLATVPWRHLSFQEVLACLRSQDRKPDWLHVVADGFEDHDIGSASLRKISSETRIRVVHTHVRGQGIFERWDLLRDIGSEDLVAFVDDDWFLDPWYLKNTVAMWKIRTESVLDWLGWAGPSWKVVPSDVPPVPLPLAYAAGGFLTARAGLLQDVWERVRCKSEYEDLRRAGWGDDLLASRAMHRLGIRRWRPKGWSHAIELPAGRAPEAVVMQHREAMLKRLDELFRVHGVDAM